MTVRWSSIRAVVLDAVGTLIYADPTVAEAYWAAGNRAGSRYGVDEIAERFGPVFRKYFRTTAPDQPTDERLLWQHVVAEVFDDVPDTAGVFEELWSHFGRPAAWAIFPDVHPFFHGLLDEFPIAVASNFDERLLTIMDGFDLPVQSVHFSAEIGAAKPSVNFFKAVEKRLRLPPQQLLMIGDDATNDFEGPRAAGWQALHLHRETGMALTDFVQPLLHSARPRFVVLEHSFPGHPSRSLHWDFMLEDDDKLLTWSLPAPLAKVTQDGITGVTRLPDHRLDYLQYEGAVSGDRGEVRRVDQGTFWWNEDSPKRIQIELMGDLAQGRITLIQEHEEEGGWQLLVD